MASRNEYRKRNKGPSGKYIAIYGLPEELSEKAAIAQRDIGKEIYHRENPIVEEYVTKWLAIRGSHVRTTTLVDYTSKVKIYIIGPLVKKYMAEVAADDVKIASTKTTAQSYSIYRSV